MSVRCRYLAASLLSSEKKTVWLPILSSLGDDGKAPGFPCSALNWLIAVLGLHAGMCPWIESETAGTSSLNEDSQLMLLEPTTAE